MAVAVTTDSLSNNNYWELWCSNAMSSVGKQTPVWQSCCSLWAWISMGNEATGTIHTAFLVNALLYPIFCDKLLYQIHDFMTTNPNIQMKKWRLRSAVLYNWLKNSHLLVRGATFNNGSVFFQNPPQYSASSRSLPMIKVKCDHFGVLH